MSQKRKIYSKKEIEVNAQKIYSDFDVDYVREINKHLINLLSKSYFRPEFIGFDEDIERNKEEHPVMLASNHSGMAFPWDAMIFGCGIFARQDYQENKLFRPLVAPLLSKTLVMNPFMMRKSWKYAGGVDATFLNFESMMYYPKGNLLVYPEGVGGIGKGFNKRYQLQRFATSFIRMSLKYKTDIVPYSTVNAEYVAPLMYSNKTVDAWFRKRGIPFFPLGPLTISIVFPFAFYLAFPCKMYFVKGKRISPWKWVDKSYEDLEEEEIQSIVDKVKSSMQNDLDEAVEEYGQKPYRLGEWIKSLWKHRQYFPYNLPLFWPFLAHEFERQWFFEGKFKEDKEVDIYLGWGAIGLFLWRNPICIAYFLPIIGWFFLIWHAKWRWKKIEAIEKAYKNESTNSTQ